MSLEDVPFDVTALFSLHTAAGSGGEADLVWRGHVQADVYTQLFEAVLAHAAELCMWYGVFCFPPITQCVCIPAETSPRSAAYKTLVLSS